MPVNATNDKFGWLAPDFNLLDVSGKKLSLNDISGSNGTVIAFICNHCPYVIAIAERLSKEAKELSKLSINTVAIMSNNVIQYPEDSYENMKFMEKSSRTGNSFRYYVKYKIFYKLYTFVFMIFNFLKKLLLLRF